MIQAMSRILVFTSSWNVLMYLTEMTRVRMCACILVICIEKDQTLESKRLRGGGWVTKVQARAARPNGVVVESLQHVLFTGRLPVIGEPQVVVRSKINTLHGLGFIDISPAG